MDSTILKMEMLLKKGQSLMSSASEDFLRQPYQKGKWSRKQIMGHLVDSALNNLTHFTEIGYQPQPYTYRDYKQEELVQVNQYQEMDSSELLQLWLALNRQIIRVMRSTDDERLSLVVKFPDGTLSNLRHIMTDYPLHMEHHINQIEIKPTAETPQSNTL